MEYTLVSGETLEALTEIVNQYLKEGWRRAGSPFVANKRLWAARPKMAKGELVVQALERETGDAAAD